MLRIRIVWVESGYGNGSCCWKEEEKKKKRMNLTALESQTREAFVRMKTAELGFHPGC
jgi:hypothetical protein